MSELYLLFSLQKYFWMFRCPGNAATPRRLLPGDHWNTWVVITLLKLAAPTRSNPLVRRDVQSRAGRVTLTIPCMVELGVSANTRAIIVERQRLLESQTADVRASKRNAALLKDLESLLQTLQRKQHGRLAQEARAASAELGGRQRRMREAQAREAQGLREALAEVHCRREQAAEEFKEELELREAAARSKQQLRVELELERFDNATRSALRLGASAEISAAEDKVQVHTAPPS